MLDKNAPWICQEDDENDYVIDRFELRAPGRKPLILNTPSFSKLMFVTQQYLHASENITKQVLKRTILDAPDPFTADEHCKLIMALEKHLRHN